MTFIIENWNLFQCIGSPMDQFEIRSLLNLSILDGSFNLTLTSAGFYLILVAVILYVISYVAITGEKLASTNWSLSLESMYDTILNIVSSQINGRSGQIYFPFIFTVFSFILINNLVGLVPYNLATTSQFVLTFALSFTVVLGATILGFEKHGLKFFSLLVPAGCPLALLPLLVLIEFISYSARCVSLGLRLGANITSGHLLLNILSTFVYKIMSSNMIFFILGLLPLALIIAFSGLELMIAVIQAQVFVVLASSYIKDGLDLH
uniref:ATP synthase subunit a n=1 Tax=Claviceps purpurea TaxID=5111 RepID=I7J675_CLAPU|nr:ATP synthase subunit a precursor [Claviceps purpurea]